MLTSYICIDLETTGLNPKRDKIIEIGAVKVVDGVEAGVFSSFVNPGRKLEDRIVALTGIQDKDLYDAPVINDVFCELMLFMEEYPLVGHSVLSDFSFLKKAAVDLKLQFERQAVDTLKIARKYLPNLESRSLESLCDHYQIPHRPHRALEDAKATVLLYQKLLERYYQEEESVFQPQSLHFKVKRDQPASARQKEKLYRMQEILAITLEADIELLSRSEASRLTDNLLATYGRQLMEKNQ